LPGVKVVVGVLILLLVAEAGFCFFVYDSMIKTVALLKVENDRLRSWLYSNASLLREANGKYADLREKHENLVREYENLRASYEALRTEYEELRSRYDALRSDYLKLGNTYGSINSRALELNSTLAELVETLTLMANIPKAFKRVLNPTSVMAVAPYVNDAGVKASDPWSSFENIYKWITSKVAYVNDVEIPVPTYVMCDANRLCTYRFSLLRNYVQEPRFTAEYGQGDCDDQAVLAYAMIKYYTIYVHGKEYRAWLAHIEFSSGSSHLAVFIPVSGGKLTILDPAGSYLTRDLSGQITSRPPLDELQKYSSHFSKFGGINYIEIYEVDVHTGQYTTLIKGDINKIASYIASTT